MWGSLKFIPVGLVDDVHLLVEVLGCKVGSFLFLFGSPFGSYFQVYNGFEYDG